GRRSASGPRAGSCRRTSSRGASRRRSSFPTSLRALPGYQRLVHDAVLYRVFGTHEKVTLGVPGDGLDRLAAVLGEDLVQASAQVQNLLGVDLDVGRLA